MKKIASVLLLCIILIGAVSCQNNSEVPSGMQAASVEGAYFDLYVPTTWTVNNQGGVSGAYYSNADKSNVSAAVYTNIDLTGDYKTVTAKPADTTSPAETTATAETSATADTTGTTDTASSLTPQIDLFWNKTANSYLDELNNFELLEGPSDVLLDGVPAKKYVYTIIFDGVKYKYQEIIAYAHEQFYVFTYTAAESNYDLHTEEVASIISVFNIKG